MTATLQLTALLFFTCGAWMYYDIRRLLFKRGYPVSVFVYSGNCWPHYRDLIARTPEPEKRRLKLRRAAMTVCFALAGFFVLLTAFTAPRA